MEKTNYTQREVAQIWSLGDEVSAAGARNGGNFSLIFGSVDKAMIPCSTPWVIF